MPNPIPFPSIDLVVMASDFGITPASASAVNDAGIAGALATLQANGGGVLLFNQAGVYKISASIVITSDNVILRGSGFGTIIQPIAGANFDAISTPIPASAGLSGFVRNYIGIEQLQIDCSKMTGSTAGQGNGIHTYGTRYSYIDRVFITGSPNWAILLDGDNTGPGNNFGYDNVISRCIFDLCNGNVYSTNCEANDFFDNRFKWCGGTLAANQPAFGSQDTTGYHLRLGSGYMYVSGNIFGKGGTYTTAAIITFNNGPCRIIGNRFDQVRNQAVTLNAGNHEFIGNKLGSPGSAISGVPAIQLGSSHNLVANNGFDTTAGGANYTYCVSESGGPFTGNQIKGNAFIAGTSGVISTNASSTPLIDQSQDGYGAAAAAPQALYSDAGIASTASAAAGAAQTCYFVALPPLAVIVTLIKMRIRFATVGGGNHYDLGIYSDNAGQPGTLLGSCASSATSLVATAATLTPNLLANLLLNPGRYWLGVWFDNNVDTWNKQTISGSMAVCMTGTVAAGPLPANMSTVTGLANSGLMPIILGLISGGWS